MLLTYEEFAEIPDRMHSFYSQAFDTLYQKHDALKSQYIRETKTGFKRELFKRCCAAFCVTSYLEEKFVFSESAASHFAAAALKYLKQSEDGISANVSPECVVQDLEKCVCMLQPDGLDLTFVHRSFQEYFAAYFAANYHDPRFKSLLDRFSRRFSDTAVTMTFDMARAKTESEWIAPTIARYREQLAEMKTLGEKVKGFYGAADVYQSAVANRISIHWNFKEAEFAPIYAISRLYPDIFSGGFWFKSLSNPSSYFKPILSSKYRQEARYGEWKKFINGPKGGIIRIEIDESGMDDWWLMELGFAEVFEKLSNGLDKIEKQMVRREIARSNIIEDFLN